MNGRVPLPMGETGECHLESAPETPDSQPLWPRGLAMTGAAAVGEASAAHF